MKRIFIIVYTLIISALSNAQNYGTGLLYSEEKSAEVPLRAAYLTRDYRMLPSSYSLLSYCPTPMSQGKYSTCTAWASTYAAYTIAEAVANNWTDKAQIDKEAFSPWFVYTMIKSWDDTECDDGSYLSDAVKILKFYGTPKKSDYFTECEPYSIQFYAKYKTVVHRIDDYNLLFRRGYGDSYSEKIQAVKMAIVNKHPVIISSKCYNSLSYAKDRWSGLQDSLRGYHAMCVVGYSDSKYGGAFLIQNSWGTYWGNGGFTWFTYEDFASAVFEAYDIYVSPKKPKNSLSGSLKLQLSTGEEMRGGFQNGVYKISGEYISGTRYRIYVSNNQPAWVYVIGSDLQNNVSKVFPPNDKISAALTYKSNNIAIPDENWFIQMDNTIGKDYVCVLYSAEELDINSVINKIRNGYGSFYDKVSNALSGKLASNSEVSFSQNTISFSAQTNKTVVALIEEVVHK